MASIYKLSGENWLYLAEKNKNKNDKKKKKKKKNV